MRVACRRLIGIDGENFPGSVRVALPEYIEALGSLGKAALAMGLSYQKAYYTIRA